MPSKVNIFRMQKLIKHGYVFWKVISSVLRNNMIDWSLLIVHSRPQSPTFFSARWAKGMRMTTYSVEPTNNGSNVLSLSPLTITNCYRSWVALKQTSEYNSINYYKGRLKFWDSTCTGTLGKLLLLQSVPGSLAHQVVTLTKSSKFGVVIYKFLWI